MLRGRRCGSGLISGFGSCAILPYSAAVTPGVRGKLAGSLVVCWTVDLRVVLAWRLAIAACYVPVVGQEASYTPDLDGASAGTTYQRVARRVLDLTNINNTTCALRTHIDRQPPHADNSHTIHIPPTSVQHPRLDVTRMLPNILKQPLQGPDEPVDAPAARAVVVLAYVAQRAEERAAQGGRVALRAVSWGCLGQCCGTCMCAG